MEEGRGADVAVRFTPRGKSVVAAATASSTAPQTTGGNVFLK